MSFKTKPHSIAFDLEEDLHLLKALSSLDTSYAGSPDFAQAFSLISSELRSLEFNVQKKYAQCEGASPLLVAENNVQRPKLEVSLICHMDTVLPPRGFVKKAGEIWGSGVADNKGGIVCALRFLKHIHHIPDVKLRFVCSPSEESGSLGFHQQFNQWGKTSQFVFGFEPAQKGALIDQRNGNRWYQVKIKGLGSHAGRMSEPCVNAAHEASHKISALSSLNDVDQFIRVNVGHIQGGEALFNRTCEDLSFKLDARFPSLEQRDRLHERLEEIFFTQSESCSITGQAPLCFYSLEDDCPPMEKKLKFDPLTKRLLGAIQALEKKSVESSHSGGAADINYFSDKYNYCLDGLGPVGSGIHTYHEKIETSSLQTRPRALAKFFHEWIHEQHTQGVQYERAIDQSSELAV